MDVPFLQRDGFKALCKVASKADNKKACSKCLPKRQVVKPLQQEVRSAQPQDADRESKAATERRHR